MGNQPSFKNWSRIIKDPQPDFLQKKFGKGGQRVGFSINTLDGKQGVLAHVNIQTHYQVGKYGVNIEHLEKIAVPSIIPVQSDELIVIDEIGKMGCFSNHFRNAVLKTLDSDNLVIGTIALKGDKFISGIKSRKDVVHVHVTEQNRDRGQVIQRSTSYIFV